MQNIGKKPTCKWACTIIREPYPRHIKYKYKFETIIQNPCSEGFDEDHFVHNLRLFESIYYFVYILCSNNFLLLPNYTLFS